LTWSDLLFSIITIGVLTIIILMSLDTGGEMIPRFADPQYWNPNIW
jgi:hypothetical protein